MEYRLNWNKNVSINLFQNNFLVHAKKDWRIIYTARKSEMNK